MENKLEQAREQIETDVEQIHIQFLANMAHIQQDVDGLRKAANRNIRQYSRVHYFPMWDDFSCTA